MLHVAYRFEAIARILFERAHDNGFKRGVDTRVDLRGRHGEVLHLLGGNAYGIWTVKGKLARCGFVKHDAQGVNVRRIGEFFALSLFWRDIVSGAQNSTRLTLNGILCVSNAKVHDLHVAVRLDHDVLWLDVAMHNVLLVRHRKSLAYLGTDFGNLALVDGTALLDGRF